MPRDRFIQIPSRVYEELAALAQKEGRDDVDGFCETEMDALTDKWCPSWARLVDQQAEQQTVRISEWLFRALVCLADEGVPLPVVCAAVAIQAMYRVKRCHLNPVGPEYFRPRSGAAPSSRCRRLGMRRARRSAQAPEDTQGSA